MDAFLQSHSRVVKVLGLPGGTTQDELVRWIVRDRSAGAGGVRGVFGSGEAAGWWVVFDDHSTVSLTQPSSLLVSKKLPGLVSFPRCGSQALFLIMDRAEEGQ